MTEPDGKSAGLPADPSSGRRDLLLLEDNPALARVVATVAQGDGWTVHTCIDAEQFAEALGHVRPSAVIVDCMLAEGSGLDVLTRLAAAAPDASVLIVSGYGESLLRLAGQTAQRCGLKRVSTQAKPFAATALRAFLQDAASPHP